MISEEVAIGLLRKYSKEDTSFNAVLSHSRAVQEVALQIAKDFINNDIKVDLDFIKIASLLHDIGRLECFNNKNCSVLHGQIGSKIILNELNDQRLASVCANHIGAGILKEEIEFFNLPLEKKDYLPQTNEEKIITYADNLIFGTKVKTFDDVLTRFVNQLSFLIAGRFIRLHNFIKENSGKLDEVISFEELSLLWLSKYLDFEKQSDFFSKILNKLKAPKLKAFIDSFVPISLILLEKETNFCLFVEITKEIKNEKLMFKAVLDGKILEPSQLKELKRKYSTIISDKNTVAHIIYEFDDFIKNPKLFFKYFRKMDVPLKLKFKILHSLVG